MKSLLITLSLLLAFYANAASTEPVLELDWDSLIPEGFRPDKILNQFGDIDNLPDDDPRIQKIQAELEAAWATAPVIPALDGKRVKLAGFVVPIEGDGEKLSEFLLVPYFGACIHVPPPPANQTVYVKVTKADAKIRKAFDTVWVTGILSAKPVNSELATAGYQIQAEQVTAFD